MPPKKSVKFWKIKKDWTPEKRVKGNRSKTCSNHTLLVVLRSIWAIRCYYYKHHNNFLFTDKEIERERMKRIGEKGFKEKRWRVFLLKRKKIASNKNALHKDRQSSSPDLLCQRFTHQNCLIPTIIICMENGISNNLRSVISLVDKLRDINLESYIQLPKIVVVGSQSSGKSSLIEQIVGIDFLPRGSGVVTRRPLEIRMIYDNTLKTPHAFFEELPGKKFTDFLQVKDSIEELTDKVCGKNKEIVDKPIILNVYSPSCPNLTLIDLPGLTRIAVGGQSEDIYKVTSQMIRRYMSDPSSVILCVIPANQDITNDQVLHAAMKADEKGERTIGCITKIDLMDRGTDARNLLLNKGEVPLKLGYVGIKNRSQADIQDKKTVVQSLEDEKMFFSKSLIYSSLPASCLGTQALTTSLTKVLESNILQFLPNLHAEVTKRKNSLLQMIRSYGKPLPKTPQEAQGLLWQICNRFLLEYRKTVQGHITGLHCKEALNKNSVHIVDCLTSLLDDQFFAPLAEGLTSQRINFSIKKYQGNNMPGFPSINSFYYLIDPLLKKLKSPLMHCLSEIARLLTHVCQQIIRQLAREFPVFCDFILDRLGKLIEGSRKKSETFIQNILQAQIGYIYTNNNDFHELLREKPQLYMNDELAKSNPMIVELKKRVNIYYKITVKNLREVVPKNIKSILLEKLYREIQFEIFQSCHGDKEQVNSWLKLNTGEIEQRRKKEQQFEVLCKAEQFLLTHPSFSKYRVAEIKKMKGKEPEKKKEDKKEESPIRKENKIDPPKDSSQKSKPQQPADFTKFAEVVKNNPAAVKEIPATKEVPKPKQQPKTAEKSVQPIKNAVKPQEQKKTLLQNLFGTSSKNQTPEIKKQTSKPDLKDQYNKKAGQTSDKLVDQMYKNESFKKQSTKAVESGTSLAAQKQMGLSQQNAALFGKGAGWMFKQDATQNYLKEQTKANVKDQIQIKK